MKKKLLFNLVVAILTASGSASALEADLECRTDQEILTFILNSGEADFYGLPIYQSQKLGVIGYKRMITTRQSGEYTLREMLRPEVDQHTSFLGSHELQLNFVIPDERHPTRILRALWDEERL